MNPAIEALIERLLNIFGPPKVENPDAYLDEIRSAMNGCGHDAITKVGDMARDECKWFPKPAELREFAARAAAGMRKPVYSRDERRDLPPPTPEQAARAAALVAEMKRNIAANIVNLSGSATAERKPLMDTSAPAFERMQRGSQNLSMHEKPRTLTERSRAMTGETE